MFRNVDTDSFSNEMIFPDRGINFKYRLNLDLNNLITYTIKPNDRLLNMKLWRNKIEALREISKKVQIAIFCIDQTKLDLQRQPNTYI